jgi:hypothetical protein
MLEAMERHGHLQLAPEVAHRMVFGATAASEMTQGDAATGAGP